MAFEGSAEMVSLAALERSRKPAVGVSVREMVEFVLRSGNLGGAGHFGGANRALEGTRGHQRLQNARPPAYEAEVGVEWEREEADFVFRLRGRIDGVLVRGGNLLVEEIKTVRRSWSGPADELHWAQGKIYAYLYAVEHGFEEAEVQITYLELESGLTVEFRERFGLGELEAFFRRVVDEYLEWVSAHQDWRRLRNKAIQSLGFPLAYREGQRALAVAAYRAAKNGGKLFVEAPTGIGKTISVLFPTIKAMGEGAVERLFYLTARTIGRAVAEETLGLLRKRGLKFRAVTITAKEKVCFNNGGACDLKSCPYALGYYDRIKGAMRAALRKEAFTRVEIEAVAREHMVCPFELSLDLSLWVDGVICDYNYVFDPTVALKRYFDGEGNDYALLVDEAHHLPERAREMFSAELEQGTLAELGKVLVEEVPGCGKALRKIVSRMKKLGSEEEWIEREGALVRKEAPVSLTGALEKFLEEAESWLVQEKPAPFRQELLEGYFAVNGFLRVLDWYGERYFTILEEGRLRLYCWNPATLLKGVLEQMGSAVLFSATLRPLEYFREALGGDQDGKELRLESPFPREHLRVLVQDRVATRLSARAGSYEQVAECIGAVAGERQGNYLVYFPSYDYMDRVREVFEMKYPGIRTAGQRTGMSEAEREEFVGLFQPGAAETLVGFAVLGGIFGEGIDLAGERLIGVVVVGVGLPQICLERDLIREQVQAGGRSGFDYAYVFPGMNRVLQAVGRVIRSEVDKGVVLLIDERFRQQPYRGLFPGWWEVERVGSAEEIQERVRGFWKEDRGLAFSDGGQANAPRPLESVPVNAQ